MAKVEINCKNCNLTFIDYLSNNRTYCSSICKYKGFSKPKTVVCGVCSKSFCLIKKGRAYNYRKYCSNDCVSFAITKNKKGFSPWNKGRVFEEISFCFDCAGGINYPAPRNWRGWGINP